MGWPTTFVRIAGCPLRCSWCDTAWALSAKAGVPTPIPDIVGAVKEFGLKRVCITGGEPLAHQKTPDLVMALLDAGCTDIVIETSGAFPLLEVPSQVSYVMDWKCPTSGESHRNHPPNIEQLRPQDEVKFVIAEESDFLWAIDQLDVLGLPARCSVLFSAVASIAHDAPGGPGQATLGHDQLATWILQHGIPVRQQLQFHKVLWPEQQRGV